MKNLLKILPVLFLLFGMSNLIPFTVYGEDLTVSELLEKAQKVDAGAQYTLGEKYKYGEGVVEDDKESLKWYSQAAYSYRILAEQGDADAQYILGYMYQDGKGVIQDYKKSAKWYTRAAEQGHTQAQFNLGWMYEQGEGVLQDYIRAYAWYSIAASQQHDVAKYNRDIILPKMTRTQIEEGQRFAKKLYGKIYK